MLRYDRQTKPGLVALYDIRPGNGAGPFLQPRSPHGAAFCVGEQCIVRSSTSNNHALWKTQARVFAAQVHRKNPTITLTKI